MNKWYGIGNLTKDVELLMTTSGVYVAKFTIAVQRKYSNENGEKETDFINCIAWRKLAENLNKYCKKGDKIAVVGEIQIRSYDAKDGSKRYVTEIVADEIEFINTKKVEVKEEEQPQEINYFNSNYDDDLPF